MKEVALGIRWDELFGRSKKDASDATRRARWEQWKDLCLKSDHPEMVEWWGKGSMADDCFSCEHKDGDSGNDFLIRRYRDGLQRNWIQTKAN